MRKGNTQFLAGFLLGIFLVCGTGVVAAGSEPLTATLTDSPIYLDGEQVSLRGYYIAGNNYFMLRDIGKALDFNVYWDSEEQSVHMESDRPYTGLEPTPDDELAQAREVMIDLINQERLAAGVPALTEEPALMAAAQECSEAKYTWHNNRFECQTVLAHGYPYGFGSNLTVFIGGDPLAAAQRAVENWTKSPGHYQTMITPDADSIGVGITVERGVAYCYMFVGKPGTTNPYG